MIRKFIIPGFLIILFFGTTLFSQSELVNINPDDIASFDKRFKTINETINYLKNKNIDIDEINTTYTEAENLFNEIKYSSELKDYDMKLRFLSYKISVLEDMTLERVSFAKRMNLIYVIMVAMGLGSILIMSGYSIYMYSRRK